MRRALIAFGLALLGTTLQAQLPELEKLPGSLTQIVMVPSSYRTVQVLAQDDDEMVTVPAFGHQVIVVFSTNSGCADFYFEMGSATCSVPTVDNTDGTASEHNPSALRLQSGDVFCLIAPTACKVHMRWARP